MALDWDYILNPPEKEIDRRSRWDRGSIATKHIIMRKRMKDNKPSKCPICKEEKKLELSNIDHEYKEDPSDWRYLCHRCHVRYDYEKGNHKFYKYFNSLFSYK